MAVTTCLPFSNAALKISVAGCSLPVRGERLALDAGGLGLLPGEGAGARQLEVDTVGGEVFVMMAFDKTGDAAAHRAETDEADVYGAEVLTHIYAPLQLCELKR